MAQAAHGRSDSVAYLRNRLFKCRKRVVAKVVSGVLVALVGGVFAPLQPHALGLGAEFSFMKLK